MMKTKKRLRGIVALLFAIVVAGALCLGCKAVPPTAGADNAEAYAALKDLGYLDEDGAEAPAAAEERLNLGDFDNWDNEAKDMYAILKKLGYLNDGYVDLTLSPAVSGEILNMADYDNWDEAAKEAYAALKALGYMD